MLQSHPEWSVGSGLHRGPVCCLWESSVSVSVSFVITCKKSLGVKFPVIGWVIHVPLIRLRDYFSLFWVIFSTVNILIDFGEILADTVWFGGNSVCSKWSQKTCCIMGLYGFAWLNCQSWLYHSYEHPFLGFCNSVLISLTVLVLRPKRKTMTSRAHFLNSLMCMYSSQVMKSCFTFKVFAYLFG